MNKTRNLLTVTIMALAIAAASFGYVYLSDHRNTVRLPDDIAAIKLEFTNVFLIPINNGYMLFDNGYEKEYGLFLQKIAERGINIKDIKYVMISHHHDDHVGFLRQMTNSNKELKIIVHEKTIPLLATGENNKKNGGGIVNYAIYALFRIKQILTPDWNLRFSPFEIRETDIVLQGERDRLPEEIGLNAEFIYTPGHSSDSVSLVYRNDYLFCGDMASNFLNWAGADYLTLFNEDIDLVYASWEKILDRRIKYILTAHGKPFASDRLKQNMKKHAQSRVVKFF